MRRNVSRITADHIEKFIDANSDSITITEGCKQTDLFKYISEKKKVIGYLDNLGLDAFKKGTKEPEAIRIALTTAKWETTQLAEGKGTSMWG